MAEAPSTQPATTPGADADGAGEPNPFEAFSLAMGAETVSDPYPDFAVARARGAVLRGDVRAAVLFPDGPPPDAPPQFTPLTFETAQAVLRDGDTYSSAGYAEVMGIVMGHSILEMDEPEHHTYRSLLQQAFTRKAMEQWEVDLVRPVVDELIDGFVDRGRADLVTELLFPFPVNVIAGLLGLPREDLHRFHRWAVELIGLVVDWERAVAASKALYDYFQRLILERREEPGPDMISVLAHAELDGQRLTDDEIIAFLRLLLPAGAETTYRSSSNLVFGLLTHPDQLAAVAADRSLVPRAIEEGLRWEPPLLTIVRTATRDTTLGGVEIPAGATIVLNLGAANRDPARWERPDEFDVFREPRQHLSFAFGPHMCLGLHLARMETSVVVNRLLDRLPNLRIDPDAEAPYITGLVFRAPPHLPVVWD